MPLSYVCRQSSAFRPQAQERFSKLALFQKRPHGVFPPASPASASYLVTPPRRPLHSYRSAPLHRSCASSLASANASNVRSTASRWSDGYTRSARRVAVLLSYTFITNTRRGDEWVAGRTGIIRVLPGCCSQPRPQH